MKAVVSLHSPVVRRLQTLGVRVRLSRDRERRLQRHNKSSGVSGVFKLPLDVLPMEQVRLECGSAGEVPSFVCAACRHIQQHCDVEGLFRKTGSTARQKELKAIINSGGIVGPHNHVIDVANLLKLFLRELPEPLLPYTYHDPLLRCLLLRDHKVDSLMLTCLLLPPRHLSTLAYLMKFLQEVAGHADHNKMTVGNLAVVVAPTVMPVESTYNHAGRLKHHIGVVEQLILHAGRIGIVPEDMLGKPSPAPHDTSSTKMKKKKRRSGSLTRMINGIKKMVGKGSPEVGDSTPAVTPTLDFSTPCVVSGKRRKGLEGGGAPFSSKKKRQILQSLPQSVALANVPCTPVHGTTTVASCSALTPTVCTHPNPLSKSKTPPAKSKTRRFFSSNKTQWESKPSSDGRLAKPRIGISMRRSGKKPGSTRASMSRPGEDWEWAWGRPSVGAAAAAAAADTPVFPYGGEVDLSDDSPDSEFVRIPKSEYEAIKSRVSAIESKISEEFGNMTCGGGGNGDGGGTRQVQTAYEKALEESVRFEDATSEQLARRLRLRRSLGGGGKVIRSPSARKIGTMRRRSREAVRTPRGAASVVVPTRPHVRRASSFHAPDAGAATGTLAGEFKRSRSYASLGHSHTGLPEEWRSAHAYLESAGAEDISEKWRSAHLYLESAVPAADISEGWRSSHPYLQSAGAAEAGDLSEEWRSAQAYLESAGAAAPATGRESVARLRSQNAGMVMARTRLFDVATPRRRSRRASPASEKENVHSPKRPSVVAAPGPGHSPVFSLSGTPKYAKARGRAIMSMSPLKDCNRIEVNPKPGDGGIRVRTGAARDNTPYIRKSLLPRCRHAPTPPCTFPRTTTPMRAVVGLVGDGTTPTPRRHSPRLVARASREVPYVAHPF